MQTLGKYLIVFGCIILVAGLMFWLFGNKLSWFGKLPGDINIEKGNVKIYIPLTTMLLISFLLSAILWIIRKFLG
ncbi:MAG: DUF2905 domain-containing protein [Bacteroidia bacterium]|nr:DUF2905 domain-containing protein [Bacteroidia bacterium]